MKTTLEILEGARDLIREPEGWCQGKTEDAEKRRCAWGALMATRPGYVDESDDPRYVAVGILGAHVPQPIPGEGRICQVARFNDSHTHAEVLELFNLAIAAELAKTQENKPKVGSSVDEPTTIGEPVLSGAC